MFHLKKKNVDYLDSLPFDINDCKKFVDCQKYGPIGLPIYISQPDQAALNYINYLITHPKTLEFKLLNVPCNQWKM